MHKNSKKKLISIVIPCYNEEASLPIFYEEMNKVSQKIKEVDFEFIFINDGSNDNTLSLIKKFTQKDERVKYISFSRNFGKEAGMYAGFEKTSGDYVAVIDADMQDKPSMLIKMYEIITQEDYDCVALYTKSHKDYSLIRKIFTKCWYLLIKKISSTEQVAGARDFRLMKRKMVTAILQMREYNRYSKGIFSFVGFKTKWLECETDNRVAGKSKFNFFKLFKYGLEGILAFSTTPLVVAALVGLIFCFIAFIAILFIIFKTLIYGDPVGGWPSLACIIIFTSGIQLFFFGVMGMYLSKIYLEVKKRPIYIIDEESTNLKGKNL